MFPAFFPLPSRVPRGHRSAMLVLLLAHLVAASPATETGDRGASSGLETTPAASATAAATASAAPGVDCPPTSDPGAVSDGSAAHDVAADACRVCDAAVGPLFSFSRRGRAELVGAVDDCAGIGSLALAPDAANVALTVLSGTPGDARWAFVVRRIDASRPVAGALHADGALGGARLDLRSTMAAPLSVAGLPALAVLLLSLIVLGRVAMRSR